jgi:hypothetical protein
VGLNPTQGMDVCVRLFCIGVVMCVCSGLARGLGPTKGSRAIRERVKELINLGSFRLFRTSFVKVTISVSLSRI